MVKKATSGLNATRIMALDLGGLSANEIAAQLGTTVQTLNRFRYTQAYTAEFHKARNQIRRGLVDRLISESAKSIEMLAHVRDNTNLNVTHRIRAATEIMDRTTEASRWLKVRNVSQIESVEKEFINVTPKKGKKKEVTLEELNDARDAMERYMDALNGGKKEEVPVDSK